MLVFILTVVLIVVVLFNSFSKFNSWVRYNEEDLKEANEKLQNHPNNFDLLNLKAVALMNLQNYPSAIKEFENIIGIVDGVNNQELKNIRKNIEFCRNPLPWSGTFLVDRSGSYIHFMFVKYFGKNRVILK